MKKFDKIIIGLFIVAAIISGVVMKINSNRKSGQKYAEIQVDGEFYKKVILDESKLKETIKIKTDLGENIIEFRNGGVRVVDADCPDKLCIKDGFKDKPGDVIVCLPNKVVIEIKGETKSTDNVDIISQ